MRRRRPGFDNAFTNNHAGKVVGVIHFGTTVEIAFRSVFAVEGDSYGI